MAHPQVRVSKHAVGRYSIFEIVLDRPEVHNAVDGPSAEILGEAWREFRDDDSLAVAILRGEGDQSFCAGADLKGLAGLASLAGEDSPDIHRHGPMGGTRIVQTKRSSLSRKVSPTPADSNSFVTGIFDWPNRKRRFRSPADGGASLFSMVALSTFPGSSVGDRRFPSSSPDKK